MFRSYLFLCYFILIIINISDSELNNQKYKKYVEHIFNKYGSKGQISFEGLEHLMFNLGLGGIEFKPNHTISAHRSKTFILQDILNNESRSKLEQEQLTRIGIIGFKTNVTDSLEDDISIDNQWNDKSLHNFDLNNIYDSKHSYIRNTPDLNCLSPISVMDMFLVNPNRLHENVSNSNINIIITPEMFKEICPILLVQIEQQFCDIPETKNSNATFNYAWEFGSIAILIISMCGLSGVALIPLTKSLAYQEILRFLISLAVGTLCGDALMHLLPHALTPSKDDLTVNHSNQSIWICGCAFLSAVIMYIIEKGVPIIFGAKTKHSHNFDNLILSPCNNDNVISEDAEMTNIPNEQFDLNNIKTDVKYQVKIFNLSPVALMVIIGDGLHNITDGLAIGAAFAIDPITGMSTALAVLCHELPHELGDFALLLQSGISVRVAFYYNIASSILSFIGMAIGIMVVQNHNSFVRWIYSATAGSFLYIALADLIPEMGHNSNNELKQFFIQILGLILGGLIMLMIGLNEDRLRLLFK